MKILKASNPRWFTQSDKHFKALSVHKATEILSDWIDNAFSPFANCMKFVMMSVKLKFLKENFL